jgi:hypothetical protein
MITIRGIIRNGRIEVKDPIDLPEGTELTIPIPEPPTTLGVRDEEWLDTPEAIESWIRWYDSQEPLEFTPVERAAREAARQEQKAFEIAQWEKRSKVNEGQFP